MPDPADDWDQFAPLGRVRVARKGADMATDDVTAAADAKTSDDVLRSLASYLSVGGYNAEIVNPAAFERKIRDGIDAEFVVAARTAVPALLAALAAAEAEIDRLRTGEADAE